MEGFAEVKEQYSAFLQDGVSKMIVYIEYNLTVTLRLAVRGSDYGGD